MQLKSINFVFQERYHNIPTPIKLTFIASVLSAIIVNYPAFTMHLQGPDGIIADPVATWYWDLQLGRFMYVLISNIKNLLTIYSYSFFVGFAIMGFIAVAICKMFKVKNNILALMIGLFIGVSPYFASSTVVFSYIETFFLCNLCALLSIYFSEKKYGIIVGGALLCCAMGFYQVSIGTAITAAGLLLIWKIAIEKEEKKKIFIAATRMVATGIIGILLYVIISKLTLYIMNIPSAVGGYLGIESLLSLDTWVGIIKNAYDTAYQFYFSPIGFNNVQWNFHIFNAIILGIGLIALIVQTRKNHFIKNIAVLFILLLLPFSMDIIQVVSPTHGVYWNYTFSYSLLIIFSVVCVFRMVEKYSNINIVIVTQYIVAGACVLLLNSYWMYNSANYVAMELSKNKAQTLAVRIVEKMENTEGYFPGMKVLFCGTEHPEMYPRIHQSVYDMTSISSSAFGMVWPDLGCAQMEWTAIMRQTVGINYQQTTIEDFKMILPSYTFQAMPVFPAEDSIQIIGDTMVVKLSSWYDNLQY